MYTLYSIGVAYPSHLKPFVFMHTQHFAPKTSWLIHTGRAMLGNKEAILVDTADQTVGSASVA